MLQPFKPMSQQCCNAVLHYKSLLQVIPCNITLRDLPIVISNSRCGKYSNAKNEARAESWIPKLNFQPFEADALKGIQAPKAVAYKISYPSSLAVDGEKQLEVAVFTR